MKVRLSSIALLLCVSFFSNAAETSWSMQVGLTSPVGAMKTDIFAGSHNTLTGFCWSGAFSLHLTNQDAIQFKAGASGLTHGSKHTLKGDTPADDVTFSSSWFIPEIGADWRRSWAGSSQGVFTELGFALAFPKLSVTREFPYIGGTTIGTTADVSQEWKSCVRAGIGYNFSKKYFCELQYHDVFVNKAGSDGFNIPSLTWLELTFGFRFGERAR